MRSGQGLTLVDTRRFDKFRLYVTLLSCVDSAAQHTDQLVGRRRRFIDLFLGLQASPTSDSRALTDDSGERARRLRYFPLAGLFAFDRRFLNRVFADCHHSILGFIFSDWLFVDFEVAEEAVRHKNLDKYAPYKTESRHSKAESLLVPRERVAADSDATILNQQDLHYEREHNNCQEDKVVEEVGEYVEVIAQFTRVYLIENLHENKKLE